MLTAAVTAALTLLGISVAALLAHRYTVRRDRRTELTAALDRAISAYTAADRAIGHLLSEVDDRADEARVRKASDLVSEQEILLRSAQFSMNLRLRDLHPLELAFGETHDAFTSIYLALEDAFTALARKTWTTEAERSVAAAHEQYDTFRARFDEAMDVARDVVGPAA